MKIIELLNSSKFIFSCELFPPKTDEGLTQLYQSVEELKALGPGYISVTYGAGGSTRKKTLDIVRKIKFDLGVESMAHLTCVGHSADELKSILDSLKESGIENVIALRGDPPRGQAEFTPHPEGFSHAGELVQFIRSQHDFCVAVAGYPEGHIESKDKELDWLRLKEKVDYGADFIVSQLFFDNQDFFKFEKHMRGLGVTVPIIPGIMPLTNFSQILRFTQLCGAKIPAKLHMDLEQIQNDLDAVTDYGIEYAIEQCRELIQRGVPGIHFYTLNRSRSTKMIVQRLKPYMRKKRIPKLPPPLFAADEEK